MGPATAATDARATWFRKPRRVIRRTILLRCSSYRNVGYHSHDTGNRASKILKAKAQADGIEWMPRRHPLSLTTTLERELQPKLNEPRIAERAGHVPEVWRDLDRIRGRKLRVVEDVEELRPELEVHPFPRPEGRSFKDGEVEVLNTIRPESRVHPRLVSETIVRRSNKAGSVKPL